jgi:hypothetical protein
MLPVTCAGLCLVLFVPLCAFAQRPAQAQPAGAETTTAEIERLRWQKLQNLRPETLPWLHRTILYVRQNRIPEKITYGYKGIRPRFGTLGPGSGFGTGIEDRFLANEDRWAGLAVRLGAMVRASVCMWTNTPDHHFVLAPHPRHPEVVLAGGCSGHAFKFVPVIGEILADLAIDGKTSHPISLFDPDRGGSFEAH